MSACGNPMFAGLEGERSGTRLGSFAASFSAQTIIVALALVYAITTPRLIPASISHIDLVAPSLDLASKPEPVRLAKVQPAVKHAPDVLPAVTFRMEAPAIAVQQPQRLHRMAATAEMAQPDVAAAKFDSKVLNALPGPRVTPRVIASTDFDGSSAPATLQHRVPSKVQTGGFGDSNGVPVNANGGGKSNIAAAGSFDLPSGPGYGNATGGTRGARGTVTSTGFGSAVAVQGGGGRGDGNAGQGRVQSAGFNAPPAVASDPSHKAVAANHLVSSVPVSIQSKPNPIYTAEARQHRVEGEVLLNVTFTADGKVRVRNVVRGLGYGLDESAQRAVQGLKFIPAMRDGHAVDSDATLHVIFQLT